MGKTSSQSPPALKRIAADPVSRRRFLAVGGGTSLAAFLAACGGDDDSSMSSTTTAGASGSATANGAPPEDMFGKGDAGIVNYALTLEYLETAFYSDVAKSGLFKSDDLATIKTLAEQEQQHVDALVAAAKQLGAKPAAAPKAGFPLDDAGSVLKLAATVENLGAAAYLGQAANIENPDILAAALSIHTVEGRHAAALNLMAGVNPTPDGAFAKPASADEVLKQVQPFLA
jgi:rubrerythrin